MHTLELLTKPAELTADPTLHTTAAALAAAALLAACGGGDSAAAPPAEFLALASAQDRRSILSTPEREGANASTAAAAAPNVAPTPTTTELLDWAERNYSVFFPGHEPNLTLDPYIYRYYPSTRNYVGVANGRVYILGPVSGDVLGDVGAVADFGPRVFAASYAFTDAQASRFLAQATLAVTDADITAVRSMGYAAWLEQEFARPVSSGNWAWLVSKGLDVDPDSRNNARFVDEQIWQRLLSAPDSLRQRVALALSEIIVVGFDGINGPFKQFQMAGWWDLLANNALGNYRTLLEAVTLNPTMGGYLNTLGNRKEDPTTGRVPDENYSREVMQLFSIGLTALNLDGTPKLGANGVPLESYTQDTVTNLARVFTGWVRDNSQGVTGPEYVRLPMVLTAALHSNLAVNFLGTTIPANTPGVTALKMALDTLANHPNVGPFIGKGLIQRLTTSNPSPAYVARVAAKFNDNGAGVRGDLKAVVRAVLLDDEARDDIQLANPNYGKLREPLLRFIQWARTFKVRSVSGDWKGGNTSDPARSLGQSPLRSPSVFNFFRPGYVPAGTAIATANLVAPEFQLANESSVAGYLNFMQTYTANGNAELKVDYSAELALAGDAVALLDRVEKLLCAYQLQPATRSTIVSAINSIASTTDAGKNNRVYTAVLLVMASLDYLVQK
jgi:uncharacterized protein (DUF1800 family)